MSYHIQSLYYVTLANIYVKSMYTEVYRNKGKSRSDNFHYCTIRSKRDRFYISIIIGPYIISYRQ